MLRPQSEFNMTKGNARPEELEALSILVGVWNTEGDIAATSKAADHQIWTRASGAR